MRITASTHPGCRHDDNQDFYRAGRLRDDTYWIVLCDGMGGMTGGGQASEMAALFLSECIDREVPELLTGEEIKTFLIESAVACNERVYAESQGRETPVSMGTTVIMVIVRGNVAQFVHAGDSRLYLARKNGITQLTHDHSIVQELLDSGRITPEQAKGHPNKNIITSALGIDIVTRIDYNERKLGRGEMLLACSDGLSNMVDDETILSILQNNDFYITAEQLVKSAVDAGGYDNITAVVLEA